MKSAGMAGITIIVLVPSTESVSPDGAAEVSVMVQVYDAAGKGETGLVS